MSRLAQGAFRYRRHTEAEVGAAVPASTAPPPLLHRSSPSYPSRWLGRVSSSPWRVSAMQIFYISPLHLNLRHPPWLKTWFPAFSQRGRSPGVHSGYMDQRIVLQTSLATFFKLDFFVRWRNPAMAICFFYLHQAFKETSPWQWCSFVWTW